MSLFDPVRLGELEIRNRIMMSPMSQRAAGEDACATDWHLVHYGSRAVGGCGLVMVEDTAVQPRGRTSHGALGLYEPRHADALRRIVSFCHSQGAAVGLQLAHAGRKAFADAHGGEDAIAPTPIAFGPDWIAPREASEAELEGVVRAFARATALALGAGFDAIEVHAAHGYLLHQFLSPLTNFRIDAYGRDRIGRWRLLLEVVEAVRGECPAAVPLLVRLPAGDGQPGGLGIEEVAECAELCADAGADMIDITGGTPVMQGRRASSEEVHALAATLVAAGRVPVAVGGGIVDGLAAERLVRERGASLVSVGRPLLANPYWPSQAAEDLRAPSPLPPTYAHALGEST
ncbi:MAG TPA: tRNA-dihydrouridine synthase [Solirubrobacteraceae bacterium]|jgi:2,4-dienoyl-CoA reductase-like NADH-dependent reductase (Old Yellow Enzyme family)|nr:tRNA-dihydrouridine synthase [Solirubrobacteraceae bacterium]